MLWSLQVVMWTWLLGFFSDGSEQFGAFLVFSFLHGIAEEYALRPPRTPDQQQGDSLKYSVDLDLSTSEPHGLNTRSLDYSTVTIHGNL